MRLKFFGYFPTSRYGYLHGKISYITDRSLQDPVILSSDFLSSFALDYNRTKIYFGFLLVKFVKQLGIEERGEVAFNLNLPWNSLQLFHTLSPPPRPSTILQKITVETRFINYVQSLSYAPQRNQKVSPLWMVTFFTFWPVHISHQVLSLTMQLPTK